SPHLRVSASPLLSAMALTRRDLLRSTGVLAGAAALRTSVSAAAPAASAEAKPPPLVDISDYAREAPRHMEAMSWEYISAGAGDEMTLRWNRESYDRLRLRTRVL